MLLTSDPVRKVCVRNVGDSPLLAGEYAFSIIQKHYQHIVDREEGLIDDRDPEDLHQMRVGSRRLGAALLIFDRLVTLPKAAREPQVRALCKVLGRLRDLDVEIATLEGRYCSRIGAKERKQLEKVSKVLAKQRAEAYAEVKQVFCRSSYNRFKDAYLRWFDRPTYKPLAQLPLVLILPDLLSPLLANILLHPGWLVPTLAPTEKERAILHALRKTCKCVRYQAELFTDFYPEQFSAWIDELKDLQDRLGKIQDIAVLQTTLSGIVSKHDKLPELRELLQSEQTDELSDWDRVRGQYLSPEFRASLHQMVLTPTALPDT